LIKYDLTSKNTPRKKHFQEDFYGGINKTYRPFFYKELKNRKLLKILSFSTPEGYLLAFFYVIIIRIIITTKHHQRSY